MTDWHPDERRFSSYSLYLGGQSEKVSIGMLGETPAFLELRRQIEEVAATRVGKV